MRTKLALLLFVTTTARSLADEPPAPPPAKVTFDADPIRDGTIIALAVATAGTLDLLGTTGELRPQQVAPGFKVDDLLFLDRIAVTQTVDPNAGTFSNLGLYAAVGFAIADPIMTGIRQDSVDAAIVDGFIYAEALTLTGALTNIAKYTVRRPRPSEVIAFLADPNYVATSTDSSLSFFSGHTAITAAVTGTATYLAFARSPHTARPWVTLAVGTVLTVFVGYERVRAASHYPSDVIAGAIAGGGMGVLVTHLHRRDGGKTLWIGYSRESAGDGGVLTLGGHF